MNPSCIFCKIVSKQIPSDIVHEDDRVVAFRDVRPVAPTHILVIPKEHVAGVAEAEAQHESLLGHALLTAAALARKLGFETDGYRTVINSGPDAGQSVFHLHVHVLAGRALAWPPG